MQASSDLGTGLGADLLDSSSCPDRGYSGHRDKGAMIPYALFCPTCHVETQEAFANLPRCGSCILMQLVCVH